jgi:hypothetical protein
MHLWFDVKGEGEGETSEARLESVCDRNFLQPSQLCRIYPAGNSEEARKEANKTNDSVRE